MAQAIHSKKLASVRTAQAICSKNFAAIQTVWAVRSSQPFERLELSVEKIFSLCNGSSCPIQKNLWTEKDKTAIVYVISEVL